MNKRFVWPLTLGAFFSFFVFGFIDNLKGPTLPSLLQDMSFSYAQGGTLLFGGYFGFVIATLVTGILADSAGNRAVLITAGLALTVGVALFSYANSFWLLFATMMVVGLGMGAIEVGGNALIVALHSEHQGRYLNLLAVFHGIGSLLVPIYSEQLLNNEFTWRWVHRYTIGLTIVLTILFVLLRYPKERHSEGQAESDPTATDDGFQWETLRRIGFTRQMGWFYLLISFYVMVELGIGAWIVEYLQQDKGFSITRSLFYLSLFFGFIMLGRLLGSFVVDKVGYLQSMLIAIIGAMILIAIGLFGPPTVALALPLSGIFLSIIFPTTAAAVSSLHKEHTGSILGLLFAFGGTGGALGPWAIGFVSDWFGIQMGFALPILYGVVVMVALLALLKIAKIPTSTAGLSHP